VSKRSDWADCKELWLHFESMLGSDRDEHDSCLVVVPYIHSIARPPKQAKAMHTANNTGMTPPWELVTNRTSLLFFVGGLARGLDIGVDRKSVVEGFTKAAKEMSPSDPAQIFRHHHNAFDIGEVTNDGTILGTSVSSNDRALSDGTLERRKLGLLLVSAAQTPLSIDYRDPYGY
jgi:hypothetical protein